MVERHERLFNELRVNDEDKQTILSFIHELFNIVLEHKNKCIKVGGYDKL